MDKDREDGILTTCKGIVGHLICSHLGLDE